ncbi:MAG: DNA polymerase III subunit alpha [Oscillospiraceae bacterium]|nr:DNA polymerase III subunit alpha [Oscillospiraceae bacterium]
MAEFVHLHVHSEYSLLEGVCKIKELVRAASGSLAITDSGVMYGVIEFYRECLKCGIKPIIGCELNNRLVLLCKDNHGYQNLMRLVSTQNTGYDKENLKRYSQGLIALSGGSKGEVCSSLSRFDEQSALNISLEYKEIFGAENFFIEVCEQPELFPQLRKIAADIGVSTVAANNVHYIKREDAALQEVLATISGAQPLNGNEYYLKTVAEMAEIFSEQELKNTVLIAERCNVEIEFGKYKLPLFIPNSQTPYSSSEVLFVQSVKEGLKKRYGENYGHAVAERADYEMSLIKKMGFTDYFLIVADFIKFARESGIAVGPGRGSGVGSVCAYALEITAVEPMRFNLLFERFLNPERISMPDFDVDFCYLRRGEVIDYVMRKYGHAHVAQIITFGTFGAKSAIRDAARTLKESPENTDRLAKLIPHFSSLETALKERAELKRLYDTQPQVKKIIDTALKIEGMPRHASTHAAGVVITREPLTDHLPLQAVGSSVATGGSPADTDGSPVTQYAMDDVEQLGLLKMDFLGLRYLTVIDHTAKAVGVDIARIDENDENVYKMLSNGGTCGIFQCERVTGFLARMKPRNIEDLAASISLNRPGPMQSIPKYLENRDIPQKIIYKHPLLKEILQVTFGCIVYQEQVMEICRKMAGFSYGRADLVRRAMSKKKPEIMAKERESFIKGAMMNNADEKLADEIFQELSGFASYAFNKSHAVAYAYIAFQTAYLRCYHYGEYMARLMSVFSDYTDSLVKYKVDIERQGLRLLPPDINAQAEFTSEPRLGGIRVGLAAIKGVAHAFVKRITHERKAGRFLSLYDFVERMEKDVPRDFNRRAVDALIKAGAFDSFSPNRHTMLSMYEDIAARFGSARHNIKGQLSLFDDEPTQKIVYVNIDSNDVQLLAKIRELSKAFYVAKASDKIKICFRDTKKVMDFLPGNGINITNTFIKELIKLCGNENIKII